MGHWQETTSESYAHPLAIITAMDPLHAIVLTLTVYCALLVLTGAAMHAAEVFFPHVRIASPMSSVLQGMVPALVVAGLDDVALVEALVIGVLSYLTVLLNAAVAHWARQIKARRRWLRGIEL